MVKIVPLNSREGLKVLLDYNRNTCKTLHQAIVDYTLSIECRTEYNDPFLRDDMIGLDDVVTATIIDPLPQWAIAEVDKMLDEFHQMSVNELMF